MSGGGSLGKPFASMRLPAQRTVVAADGSDVRVLLALKGGSMAHFSLQAGQTAAAVTHRTVEEVWYVVEGRGEMWRKQGSVEETVALTPGICLTIPLGTHFQFRAAPDQALAAVCVTMPPWPSDPDADEAVPVSGPWTATRAFRCRLPAVKSTCYQLLESCFELSALERTRAIPWLESERHGLDVFVHGASQAMT